MCDPDSETKSALAALRTLEELRTFRDQHPDNFWAHRAYMNRVPMARRDEMIAEYSKLYESHKEDANYTYYYGSALVGATTKEAIRYLDLALEKNADLAPAHSRLVVVYG